MPKDADWMREYRAKKKAEANRKAQQEALAGNPYTSWSVDQIRREIDNQTSIINEKRLMALMSYPAKTSPAYTKLVRSINAARKAYDAAIDKRAKLHEALEYAEEHNQDIPF